MAQYKKDAEYSNNNETRSFQGAKIDFGTVTGKPSTWYDPGDDDAL